MNNYKNTPIIMTKRLILRRFELGDLKDLFEIFSDKEVNKYLPWYPIKNLEEAKEYLNENYIKYYKLDKGYRYAISLKDSNKVIGYLNISDEKSQDLGYGVNKKYWGKGYATEACMGILEYLKNKGHDYITATHDIKNIGSGKVLEKIGMEYKYSYKELWKPKNIEVILNMYQINLDGNIERVYMEYLSK